MRYAVETDYKLLIRNYFQHRWAMAIIGSLLAVTLAVAGYFAPKKYESYATLLIEGQTMIAPLMKGAAVSNANNDWGKIAEEIVYSRKTMARLMRALGLVEGEITTKEDDALMDRLRKNTKVSLTNDQYLRIQFRDSDPYFAKDVATQLTSLFIDETHGYRIEESQDAFEFIDTQVKEYEKKLLKAEEKLAKFKIQEQGKGVSSEDAVTSRLLQLQNILDSAELELSEAQIKQSSLESQLSGEVKETVSLARQSQYIERLQSLEDKLASLRLSYHETYPDIVSIKGQIEDLRGTIRRERSNQSSGDTVIDQSYKSNKVYQGLKIELSAVRTQVASLTARIEHTKKAIEAERKKGEDVHSSEATLAELARDYKVNKELYEDLLKRREAARVSKEIDESQKGLNIKVYEPAFLPLKPAGFRFIHFVLAGIILGLIVPIGLIYAYQLIDRSSKSPERLQSRMSGVPVMDLAPVIQNKNDVKHASHSARAVNLLYLLAATIIVVIGYLKYLQES